MKQVLIVMIVIIASSDSIMRKTPEEMSMLYGMRSTAVEQNGLSLIPTPFLSKTAANYDLR